MVGTETQNWRQYASRRFSIVGELSGEYEQGIILEVCDELYLRDKKTGRLFGLFLS